MWGPVYFEAMVSVSSISLFRCFHSHSSIGLFSVQHPTKLDARSAGRWFHRTDILRSLYGRIFLHSKRRRGDGCLYQMLMSLWKCESWMFGCTCLLEVMHSISASFKWSRYDFRRWNDILGLLYSGSGIFLLVTYVLTRYVLACFNEGPYLIGLL